ncbi:MAG: hypothetical protein H6710_13985 [Myxococcales bacterium]|nr:hypothetical protein [Myxococcales bacterium]MCB9705019.1 hypothetical protein [Myxococcales bacterium]
MLDLAILALAGLTIGAMALPRLRATPTWRAMITPLASIIGSGFLVLGPILDDRYGAYAPLAMAALCLVGWLFGAAVRHNIAAIAADGEVRHKRLEDVAELALAFAYVISVAYYLNLFGAFAVSLTEYHGGTPARVVTTGALALVALAGWVGGFRQLERVEYGTVTLKLGVIAGLLVGLGVYFAGQASAGALVINPPQLGWGEAISLGFGLIVTVQGFETARYLGDEYDAATRIRAMKQAQWLSSGIYMVYIGLLAWLFPAGETALTETAIIDMMRVVAPILPGLLIVAALAAQFSAAVADTGGAGGLVHELSRGRIGLRPAYLVLVIAGIALTWTADLFSIIAYASRAFAAYYAMQSALAALRSTGARRAGFWALTVLGAAITLLGTPAEGS